MTRGEDFFLRELVKELKKEEPASAAQPVHATGAALVLIRALDYALDVVGMMGKEVILNMLEERYGLHAEDMVTQPGPYISALKGLLGETCDVIEASMLEKIEADTGLRDWNLESTVDLLKKSYR
jgi:hypothetical protein